MKSLHPDHISFAHRLYFDSPVKDLIYVTDLREFLYDFAHKLQCAGINQRDLSRQLYLHLQRLGPQEITTPCLFREASRLTEKIVLLRKHVPDELTRNSGSPIELHRTWLNPVDASLAQLLHQSYHYLGSYRGDGIHLGLHAESEHKGKSRLLSLVTLSPFDLSHIIDALPAAIDREQVMVLSRLFAFDWCPQNTISYTLGKVFTWLREQQPHIKLLLTYLNPNLGFTGTVYKATNWSLFGREAKQRYLYLDDDYVTDRQMIDSYGTADVQKLRPILGHRISTSINPLQPLEIYAYFLDRVLRRKYACELSYDFMPNTK